MRSHPRFRIYTNIIEIGSGSKMINCFWWICEIVFLWVCGGKEVKIILLTMVVLLWCALRSFKRLYTLTVCTNISVVLLKTLIPCLFIYSISHDCFNHVCMLNICYFFPSIFLWIVRDLYKVWTSWNLNKKHIGYIYVYMPICV